MQLLLLTPLRNKCLWGPRIAPQNNKLFCEDPMRFFDCAQNDGVTSLTLANLLHVIPQM